MADQSSDADRSLRFRHPGSFWAFTLTEPGVDVQRANSKSTLDPHEAVSTLMIGNITGRGTSAPEL
jgi:hypothetical protein